MGKIVLYDLPSKKGVAWSFNPWRSMQCSLYLHKNQRLSLIARMILNFKGLDYETQWVEYPDIAPTMKAL